MMLSLLALTFVLSSMSQAQAKNTPCSGKMGAQKRASLYAKMAKLASLNKYVVKVVLVDITRLKN